MKAAAASGVWTVPYSGALLNYTSGGGSISYAYPPSSSGAYSAGLAMASGNPYTVTASGNLYTPSGAVLAQVGSFGTPAIGLADALGVLWSILPALSGVGSFDPGTLVTGFVATPMAHPAVLGTLSPGATGLVVGGWDAAYIPSGFSSIALHPTVSGVLAGASLVSGGTITLWQNDGSDNWSQSYFVTGAGSPLDLAWTANGTTLFVSDPTNNKISVYNFIFGAIVFAQNLAVSGATSIACTHDSIYALACQPTLNAVTPIVAVGSGWVVSGASVAMGNPRTILNPTSDTSFYVGTSSGITSLTLTGSGGAWVVTSTLPLSFAPTYLDIDTVGTLYAAGSSGGVGYVYSNSVTGTFSGTVGGLANRQSEVYVADSANNVIRTFGFLTGPCTQYSTVAIPSGAASMLFNPTSLLVAGSGQTAQFRQSSPFNLVPEARGSVSLYNGSSWTSYNLKVPNQPSAITTNPSGVIYAGIGSVNQLASITSGVVTLTQILQFVGQPQAVPIGFSSLFWLNGNLWATTVLNDEIIQVL